MRQPERSESGAKDRYLGVLRRSIRCVHPHVELWLGPVGGNTYSLVTSERPIPLQPGEHGKPLFLTVEQSVEMVDHPDYAGDHKLTTRGYYYGVYDTDEVDTHYSIMSWHWQPNDANWPSPHLHAPLPDDLGRHSVGGKLHIPTGGRVTIEQVIRFLIEEGLVAPAHDKWDDALKDSQARFDQFRTPA